MLERVAKREAGKSSQKGFKKRAEAHLLKCFERVQLGAGAYPIGGPALGSCALCVSTDLAVSELHRSSCIQSPSKPAHNRFECKVISICHSPTYPRNQGKRKIQNKPKAIRPDLFLPRSPSNEGGRRREKTQFGIKDSQGLSRYSYIAGSHYR